MNNIFFRLLAFLVFNIAPILADDVVISKDGQIIVNDGSDHVVIDGKSGRIHVQDATDEVIINGPQGNIHVRDGSGEQVIVNSNSVYVYDDVVNELGAVRSGDDIIVSMNNDVLFDFDSAKISSQAVSSLEKLSFLINKDRKGYIVVSGHTDSLGSKSYNQELSERRAGAVTAWLHRHANIPVSDMISQGFGETAPVALNVDEDGEDYPAGRSKNRRVEIVIQTVKKDPSYLRGTNRIIKDAAAIANEGANLGVAGARLGVAGAAAGVRGAAIGLDSAASGLAAANEALSGLDQDE